jgi:K+-sensing histidine kinase KdpD
MRTFSSLWDGTSSPSRPSGHGNPFPADTGARQEKAGCPFNSTLEMRRERSSLLRYGGALVVVLLALLLRWQLTPWLGSRSPVSLFVLAILISAQYGGLGPGLLATGLSTLSVVYFFEQPGGVLTIANPADRVALALFALVGIGISGFASGRRRAEAALRDANETTGGCAGTPVVAPAAHARRNAQGTTPRQRRLCPHP